MKFLYDQNISHRLVKALASIYPGSSHVKECGLEEAGDEIIWTYAREHDFTLVSKDSDFLSHCFLRGFPPKVIWIRLGNCSTSAIETLLRDYQSEIVEFHKDPVQALLVIP